MSLEINISHEEQGSDYAAYVLDDNAQDYFVVGNNWEKVCNTCKNYFMSSGWMKYNEFSIQNKKEYYVYFTNPYRPSDKAKNTIGENNIKNMQIQWLNRIIGYYDFVMSEYQRCHLEIDQLVQQLQRSKYQ